jgi:alpha-tubulin suppressor-like RCC1 family protein
MAVVSGVDHSLALKSDGTVLAWGYNGDCKSTVPLGLSGVGNQKTNNK